MSYSQVRLFESPGGVLPWGQQPWLSPAALSSSCLLLALSTGICQALLGAPVLPLASSLPHPPSPFLGPGQAASYPGATEKIRCANNSIEPQAGHARVYYETTSIRMSFSLQLTPNLQS